MVIMGPGGLGYVGGMFDQKFFWACSSKIKGAILAERIMKSFLIVRRYMYTIYPFRPTSHKKRKNPKKAQKSSYPWLLSLHWLTTPDAVFALILRRPWKGESDRHRNSQRWFRHRCMTLRMVVRTCTKKVLDFWLLDIWHHKQVRKFFLLGKY